MKRLFALSLLCTSTCVAEPAVPAGAFVDSIGINVHLHYTDTVYYTNFGLIEQALLALHVHHLRDGVVTNPVPAYLERHRLLASLGLHTIFITQPSQGAVALADFVAAANPALEGLEAPNELDNSTDKHWAATLRSYEPALYAFTSPRHIVNIGPSLVQTASYPELGNVSAWQDFANLHNYPGGRNPGTSGWGDNGYGSFAFQLRNLNYTSPGQPVMTTETGYDNDPGYANFVPQAVAAKYLPRLLLLQYLQGVRRTYLYELLSSGTEDYGLLTSQGVRKPAFNAVAALTSLLAEPLNVTSSATDIALTISGTDASVRHLLLRKADGTIYLALWIESSGYDVPSRTVMVVPPQTALVHLPFEPALTEAHQWQPDGSVLVSAVAPGADFQVHVTDLLTIYKLTQRSAASRTPLKHRTTRSS